MYRLLVKGLIFSWILVIQVNCNESAGHKDAQNSSGRTSVSRREVRAITRRIDDLLTQHYQADQPGAAVIVAKSGKVLLRKGYGMANVELGIPIEPHMLFNVGSLSKPFLAVGIMMLVEQGQISLDDHIASFVPDYPVIGEQVQVRHLLSHTSGIKNYTGVKGYAQRLSQEITVKELVDLFKNEPPDFVAGKKWHYSNSGYVLLGMILEKASRMSYEEFLQRNIFDPLDMNNSYFSRDRQIFPGRVNGYHVLDGKLQHPPYMSLSHLWAAGALITNVDDLLNWEAALAEGRLLAPATRDLLFTPTILNNGDKTEFTLGWEIMKLHGRIAYAHGGGIYGYVCHTLRIPEEQLFVAILSNRVDPDIRPGTATLAELVAALALGESIDEENRVAFSLSQDDLAKYPGRYRIAGGMGDGAIRRISVDGNHVYYETPSRDQSKPWRKTEIFAQDRSTFFVPGKASTLTFDFDEHDEVVQLVIGQPGGRQVSLVKQ